MKGDFRPFIAAGRIVWTMTTNGYKYYTLNLIKSIERSSIPWKLCVICCDQESYVFFRRESIPCIGYTTEIKGQTLISPFGSEDFAMWNRKKVEILDWFNKRYLELGITHSLYLDGDIVLNGDPWPVLEGIWSSGGPSLLFQCDCNTSENHSGCSSICSGVIAERHSESHKLYEFHADEWLAAQKQDQPYILGRLKKLEIPFYTLERRLFANGKYLMELGWKDGQWILLHYNYMVGPKKKYTMKKHGHWYITVV